MIPSPSVEILTWLEEPGRNSQNVNKVVVEPHQWNFLEICALEVAGNLPEVTGNVVHGEVSHQKHSDILLPQGGLKEAVAMEWCWPHRPAPAGPWRSHVRCRGWRWRSLVSSGSQLCQQPRTRKQNSSFSLSLAPSSGKLQ